MTLSRCEYKEVDFHTYCPRCKHAKEAEIDSPCEECLGNPVNLYSKIPIKFKEG